MSKKKSCKIHIREIDLKFFKYLYSSKVATSSQIARDIYTGISHQALYKRLNKMIKLKIIEARYIKELGGRLVYSLSKRTLEEYFLDKRKGNRQQTKSDSILHDLDLLDIKQMFLKSNNVSAFTTENVLLSGIELNGFSSIESIRRLSPDALLNLKINSELFCFALEYERSLKFSNRYNKFFSKYYANNFVDGVLLIGRDLKMTKNLMAKEESIMANSQRKFFYCDLETITNAKNKLEFINLSGDVIVLGSDGCNDGMTCNPSLSFIPL